MNRLRESWRSTERGRAIGLALVVTWLGLSLSAVFPQDADAIGPLLPIVIGGGLLAGAFGGDTIVGAAGDLVLKGVQAILDWIYGGLTDTMRTLNPTLQYAGPHVTVCNYFTYFWTFFADHISDEDATGTVQRVQVKLAPLEQENSLASFGATEPANADHIDPVQHALFGDGVQLHDQLYNAAVDENGNADCESGQRGYLERNAKYWSDEYKIVVDPHLPGNSGTTFTGRPRVPAGQTFDRNPKIGPTFPAELEQK